MAIVDLLLRSGANVNANDERVIGNTPLGDCVATASYEMIQRLLDPAPTRRSPAGCS